ncbi:hypothetical protein SPBRAN_973 [uncultured Candidatus Thioglobus sp.]|nr:hypothetical protein SPBRAN_973 [uncultured Candidatus Thioglobus sp.]
MNNHQKFTFHQLGNFLNPALVLLELGLIKSPSWQKLNSVNHPYLCKGLILFLLLLSTAAFALKPHTATYTLSVSDFKIATEYRTLTQKNNSYLYRASAKTTGLASLIKDYEIKAQSTFSINEFGLHSSKYQYFERDGDVVKKDINITLNSPQVDSLSLFLAFTYALEKNPNQTDFYFKVNDGKEVKEKHYQQVKSDDKNLIKIVRPGKQLEAYFAKNKHYLPVLINKKKFSYTLTNVVFTK